MSEVLLATKLHAPLPSPVHVPRAHLLRRLDEALGRGVRLVLISAPAGFGKTTLLSEWLAGLPGSARAVWLSLDETDNDPARFLAYLCAALDGSQILAAGRLADLAALPFPQRPTEHLTALVNSIAGYLADPATSAARRLLLVLDDYHVIANPAVHDAVGFVLDHLPDSAHLAIASRAEPPLGLARLRGRGQLLELRQRDLAFSLDETRDYLQRVMSLPLALGDITALEARTEGWIAGLQMAALSLQVCGDRAAFVRAFAGSDHYIFDYLMEEVLHRQGEDLQAFLLQTSVLERMTGPLCDALLSTSNSALVLEQLEHANLFLVPLDTRRQWYRTHRLFRDLLHEHLVRSRREGLAALHHRASVWYEENGLIADAVHHALEGQDWERAAHLIEGAMEPALKRGEFATALAWLEALPESAAHDRPRLALYRIWGLLGAGRSLAEVEAHLRLAEERDAPGLAGPLAVLRAILAMMRGDVARALDQANLAQRLLPEDDLFFRGLVARSLGTALLLGGGLVAAESLLREDERISRRTGDLTGRLVALRLRAGLLMMRGQLRQAREVFAEAEPLLHHRPGTLQPAAAKLLALHGDLLREANELEAAARRCQEAIDLAHAPLDLYGLGAYLCLARVGQAQGDYGAAHAAFEEALRLALRYDVTELDDALVYAYRARLFLAEGDLKAAATWSRECGLDAKAAACQAAADLAAPSLPYHVREIQCATLARVCLAEGQGERALAVLRPLLAAAEGLGRTAGVIENLALQALAFQALGQAAQALAALARALGLAEPEGFVRTFADEGAPMARLLEQAAAKGVHPAYAARLLVVLGAPPPAPERAAGARLAEPLTEREREVLRLLSAGLSNPEIADALVITVETVRSHCKSIYGKLGVHKRWAAAHRAQELGLLQT